MKAIRIAAPATLDTLHHGDVADPGAPGSGEIRVALSASSLNFHDFAVVTGMIPAADGRIPMSDGAGTVEAVGEGVTQFKAGDTVVSIFFPDWLDGAPPATLAGDVVADFLREFYAVTEGADPDGDRELGAVVAAIGARVALR